jgi:site-specific recombinase XerD
VVGAVSGLARGRYKKGLKEIGALCRIEQRLTSYVSRHSFATQAMLNNILLEAVSALMAGLRLRRDPDHTRACN